MMQRRAVLSDDREYRYSLERIWYPLKPRVLWLMLNPSTADENFDDATIRRCVGFSQRWGFGGLAVGNLFALRSTDSSEVLKHPDPVGPEHDFHLDLLARECDLVVCAWGGSLAASSIFTERVSSVFSLLTERKTGWLQTRPTSINCLGTNGNGTPKHPVRLSGDTKLQPFEWRADDESP